MFIVHMYKGCYTCSYIDDVKNLHFKKWNRDQKSKKYGKIKNGALVLLENEINSKVLATYPYSDCYHIRKY